MRDYSQVCPQFWISGTGKSFRGDPEAQIVALYLMTSPHSTMTGVFHCPVMYIAHETGLGMEGASEGLQRTIEGGFCEYEEASEVVFVVKMAAFQIGDRLSPGDNRVKGLIKDVQKMPSDHMRSRFLEVYGEAYCLEKPPKKATPSKGASKPLRSQEQEQEGRASGRFAPPSLGQIDVFIRENGYDLVDAESFHSHYSAVGWRVGKNPMKDWKAAVRGWNSRERNKSSEPHGQEEIL